MSKVQTRVPIDVFDCPACKKPVAGVLVVDLDVDTSVTTGEVSGTGKAVGLLVSHKCGQATQWGGTIHTRSADEHELPR